MPIEISPFFSVSNIHVWTENVQALELVSVQTTNIHIGYLHFTFSSIWRGGVRTLS